jgi:hypothetical protein
VTCMWLWDRFSLGGCEPSAGGLATTNVLVSGRDARRCFYVTSSGGRRPGSTRSMRDPGEILGR